MKMTDTPLSSKDVQAKDIIVCIDIKVADYPEQLRVINVVDDGDSIVVTGRQMATDEPDISMTLKKDQVVKRVPTIDYQADEYRIYMRIKPIGFWSDIITVSKNKNWDNDNWKACEISWSSGGTDGTVSSIETTGFFIEALQFAQTKAAELDATYSTEQTTEGE